MSVHEFGLLSGDLQNSAPETSLAEIFANEKSLEQLWLCASNIDIDV